MMEIGYCPVVRPTLEEFNNFQQYVEKLDRLYKDQWGMVKVVPPPQWKPRNSSYRQALQNLNVNGPIQQNIFGKGGVYECLHIQKKSLTLREYRLKTQVFDKITQELTPQQVENMFWKNIVFSPPLYGADLLNTLMDDRAGSWNLGKLDSLLQFSMDTKVKGVNTPYCYIGSWKTLFCWHKQDLDLSAINFLHQGKSKFWYSIPQSQGYILENQAKRLFPQHFRKCDEYLRHKTTLINPYNLKRKYPQLKITKVEHKKGEFICVFGGAYHCGFNFGCNIAEAINYGTLDWLTQVTKTRPCKCSKSSVKASIPQIYQNLLKTKYAKTEEFERFKEFVYSEMEGQESEEDSKEVKVIKSIFTKKIQKNKHVKKLEFKGEEYDIDKWAQCEKCKIWRKVKKQIRQTQSFVCKNTGKICHTREKIQKNYITL